MSPITESGLRELALMIEISVSFITPASIRRIGGMSNPSWKISVVVVELLPGISPPTSVWWATVAANAHKPVVMDEAWLYKVPNAGIGTALIHEQSTVRDTFGFFEPLDQRFLIALVAYDRSHGVLYVSPFWTGEFFAYLDWTPQLDVLTPAAVRAQAATAAAVAVRAGRFSATGRTYGALTR